MTVLPLISRNSVTARNAALSEADLLKAWGDVLAKQGNSKDALAKYDEALKYAPNWKQLKEAREALAKQKA
jgi:Tetratricopeptide repeat